MADFTEAENKRLGALAGQLMEAAREIVATLPNLPASHAKFEEVNVAMQAIAGASPDLATFLHVSAKVAACMIADVPDPVDRSVWLLRYGEWMVETIEAMQSGDIAKRDAELYPEGRG